MRRDDQRPLRKWDTYPQWKKDEIIDAFWREYFAKYPDEGALIEMNNLRAQFSQPARARPDYETWKRERTSH